MCLDDTFKGKVVRCYGEPRKDQKGTMFFARSDGTIVANLEGYAIIPIEEWEKLTGRKFYIGGI